MKRRFGPEEEGGREQLVAAARRKGREQGGMEQGKVNPGVRTALR